MSESEEKEYLTKFIECNTTLKRLRENLVIDLGKFSIAILYILGKKFGRPTRLYGASYGEIEFSVGVIKFKLQFLPKTPGVKLYCRHLEGIIYIDTRITFSEYNPADNFIDKIEEALQLVKPNDGL